MIWKASKEQIRKAWVEMSKVPYFYIEVETMPTCYFIRAAFNIITYLTFGMRSLNVSAFMVVITKFNFCESGAYVLNCF